MRLPSAPPLGGRPFALHLPAEPALSERLRTPRSSDATLWPLDRSKRTGGYTAWATLGETRAADQGEAVDIALAASGDGRAFERLYRSHVGRVHALARRLLGDELADDLTQDVFVRAWHKLSSFRGESAFGTWLHRLAVNVVLSRRATLGTEHRLRSYAEDALEHAVSAPETPELSLDFEAAIEGLPNRAREVFVLHDIEGYPHEEIARLLGIAPGTSKSQLHHARMALRRYLEP